MRTLQEEATIHFYHWEARGRGYLIADAPVSLEPPYTPFRPPSKSYEKAYDDGKVPNIFNRIGKLIGQRSEEENDLVLELIEPNLIQTPKKRKALSIIFPSNTEIDSERSIELLNLLCFSEEAFSFEILSQKGRVTIIFTASANDIHRFQIQLQGIFPQAILRSIEPYDVAFDLEEQVAIADFGLDSEFMLPTEASASFNRDPLTSLIATLSSLDEDETALFQIIFQGVTAPWSRDVLAASSDGRGGSFFEGEPEFFKKAHEKVSYPLFGAVIRVSAQGYEQHRSQYIASELAHSISSVSSSSHNRLIPLSNEGYPYEDHLRNVFERTTNRLPCILNSAELAHFVHYPNRTVVSEKLGLGQDKTKQAEHTDKAGVYIGENEHHGSSRAIYLETESRLSHTHIVGATGTGKSTLIANMMLQDIEAGRGCAIFDPHGDICEDILKRIPERRIRDVILIDPSDSEFPIGFNLFEAKSDAEKIVLASDIVSAFKRHATAWGDNMTAVLSNATATILESSKGGTLIELKRFLIEEGFREQFLESVDDPSLHYYWKHEYPMMRKGIAPLLTRIDTFLRPKPVRYMLAQKDGVDIARALEDNMIVLLKLSQGLIGESNSHLLGAMFLAKFNQAILGRQSLRKDERSPYFLYLDEFQNFITPSIEKILSGSRKYGVGLTVAHQELAQIQDVQLLNSVISNPKTRICFRLGDSDAKKLESGFSYFEQDDLQNLERGQAIMRISSNRNDFNLRTFPLEESVRSFTKEIIQYCRSHYATHRDEVEHLLRNMLPRNTFEENLKTERRKPSEAEQKKTDSNSIKSSKNESKKPPEITDEKRELLIDAENESREVRAHTHLQSLIKKLGQDRNFIATIEAPTAGGGRIDVLLQQDQMKIAFEISETNKPEYEVSNIKKCLRDGCIPVVVVSKSRKHLDNINQLAIKKLTKKDIALVKFIQPNEISFLLDSLMSPPEKSEEMIKGFRVVTEYESSDSQSIRDIKSRLKKLFKPKK